MKLKNNLFLRGLTGLVYVALIVAALFGDLWISGTLFALFIFLAMREALLHTYQSPWRAMVESIVLFGAFGSTWQTAHTGIISNGLIYVVLMGLFVLVSATVLKTSIRKQFEAIGLMLYIFGGMYLLLKIGAPQGDFYLFDGRRILFVFMLIWSSDTFAYLFGRKIGKTPLAKSISPNKTIEGLIAGAVCTLLISPIGLWMFPEASVWQLLVMAFLVVAAGSLGDLLESKWKREHGIKDSGNILPGHGGMLDRLDSALLAGPVVYVFLHLIEL